MRLLLDEMQEPTEAMPKKAQNRLCRQQRAVKAVLLGGECFNALQCAALVPRERLKVEWRVMQHVQQYKGAMSPAANQRG